MRLKEELEKRGVATETVTTDKVVAYLTGKGDIALTCFSMPDFVLFLDKDNYVAQMLEGLGIGFIPNRLLHLVKLEGP